MSTEVEDELQRRLTARPTCQHKLSAETDWRCPSCKAILRRCCLSALSFPHLASCVHYVEGKQ